MTEIEIKASLHAVPAEIAAKASALGFEPDYTCTEDDTYYNGIDRDFRKTDEALRIRSHTQGGRTDTLLTYKGAKQDSVSMTREELETAAEDADTLRRILSALGFRPVLHVVKKRQSLAGTSDYAGIHVCLDEVEGLGAFIELEDVAPEDISDAERASRLNRLLSLLDQLGIDRADLTTRSYLEMLLAGR